METIYHYASELEFTARMQAEGLSQEQINQLTLILSW